VKLITGDEVPVLAATFTRCISTRLPLPKNLPGGTLGNQQQALWAPVQQSSRIADAVVSDANIETLRSQKDPGKLDYQSAYQTHVEVLVSFNGFGEALDALQKQ
jgi:hypothetical protein